MDYCSHSESIGGKIYCDYFDTGYMLCQEVVNCPEDEEVDNCKPEDCLTCKFAGDCEYA